MKKSFVDWVGELIHRDSPAAGLSLDVGCGVMRYAESYRNRAFGCDPRRGVVPAAVSVADALPFADASFDFATSFQCLYYVKDIDRAADELLRVLRPGSVAIVSVSGYLHLLNEHFRASRLPQVHGRAWWERLFASVGFDLLDVNLPPRYHTPSLRGQVSHFVRPYQFFRLQVPSPQAQA